MGPQSLWSTKRSGRYTLAPAPSAMPMIDNTLHSNNWMYLGRQTNVVGVILTWKLKNMLNTS